ncbi:MAG: 1-phosphofructokinase family hexose kinase [Clostridiales bacterium]|nr:1-phosphofructokinase family hexose kinase [Clostridiales bacterium]
MILSLCLNPSIDKSICLDQLIIGSTNRSCHEAQQPGGKGINCAGVLADLGHEVSVASFISPADEASIAAGLHSRGSRFSAVYVEQRLRVNLKLIDSSRGEVTEINAAGPQVGEKELAQMSDLVGEIAADCEWALLCGSMPPGCPDDYYRQLMGLIRQVSPSCRIALDVPGLPFRFGMQQRPDLVKPNLQELSFYLGYPVKTLDEAYLAAKKLRDEGAGSVIVSMGGMGALLSTHSLQAFAPALNVPIVSTVGAGDAMLSAYIAGLIEEKSESEAFRLAVGAAAARVAGKRYPGDEYVKRVQIQLRDDREGKIEAVK